jgi:hypothetical protein
MEENEFRRISIWVPKTLYAQIKENADKSFLRVSTYVRQLICTALKNNIELKNSSYGKLS